MRSINCANSGRAPRGSAGFSLKGEFVAERDDLLERGFQLACFIFPERSTAIRILTGAMNKLQVQRGRESRRAYWRDKHLKRGITRITRDENDTLQWLIFFESDAYEKQQEARGHQTAKDMVVRYIKILVRAGTAMSSFYVNIGLHRLLHSYSTVETQRLYEAVTDRYPGADEYRRAKSVLMGKLLDRFGDLLTTSRAQHGELRFETEDDPLRWANLVEACLNAFTPWSTLHACPVPSDFNANHAKLPPHLSGDGRVKVDPNLVEINRCHAFIDPICCGRLAQALTFEPPQKKLAVPRFNMENVQKHNNSEHRPSGLTAEERKSISDSLSQQSSRRGKARTDSARIVVDGAERLRMPLSRRNDRAFIIQEGAELIELWSEDADGEDLLLGVHPVAYTQTQGIAEERIVLYQNRGRRLVLTISPEPEIADQPGRAIVTFSSQPGLAVGWLSGAGAARRWGLGAGSLAAAVILLGIGWLLGSRTQTGNPVHQQPGVATNGSRQNQPAQPSPQPAVETARSYRLIPDELITRGGQGAPPVIALLEAPSLIVLELPVSAEDTQKPFRAAIKRFDGRAHVLMEDMLKANRTSSGWIVDFPVPSRLLQAGEDYTVDLRIRGAGGTLEEVTSYTFHAR